MTRNRCILKCVWGGLDMGTEEKEVDEVEMVDEVHQRVDALISVLVDKGLITREEVERAFNEQGEEQE